MEELTKISRFILENIILLPKKEEILIPHSLHRIIAQDVKADIPSPPFNRVLADGYALKSEDTKALPAKLTVIGKISAGDFPSCILQKNQCLEVMTGSALPQEADAVVKKEDVTRNNGVITVFFSAGKGENVKLKGKDLQTGELLIEKGTFITPLLLARISYSSVVVVSVYKRPVIGIITTGNELVSSSSEIADGQIRVTNNHLLYGLIKEAGCIPKDLGIVRDELEKLQEVISGNIASLDGLITTGGLGKGDKDVVRQLFSNHQINLWELPVQPGKYLAFGQIKGKPFWGFSGAEGAVFTSFKLFAHHALLKLAGKKNFSLALLSVILGQNIKKKQGLIKVVKASLNIKDGICYADPNEETSCQVLLFLDKEKEIVEKGEIISALPLF